MKEYILLNRCIANEFTTIPQLAARALPGVREITWNQHGAISVVQPNGSKFGIKPREFACFCDELGNELEGPRDAGLAKVWHGNEPIAYRLKGLRIEPREVSL